jgi:hypothetical protein
MLNRLLHLFLALAWCTVLAGPTAESTTAEKIRNAEELFYSFSAAERMAKLERLLTEIEKQDPNEPYAYWAHARMFFFQKENYYVNTENMKPDELRAKKLELAELCHTYSDKCLKLNEKNAECHLLKGSCYAMQASTWGPSFKSLRICRPMDLEWEKAMKLPSTFKHQDEIPTRQLAKVLRAILYRVMPDSWWFRFLAGVRGDKKKAYEWLTETIHSPPMTQEPMLLMEKAASTMCWGRSEKKPELVQSGIQSLEEGLKLRSRYAMDDLDKKNMKYLLEHPNESCNYRRERFEDLSDDAVNKGIQADR